MKKTLTKAISLLMSAVMTISALSLANFSSFAETDSSTEQTIGNQDSDIKYGGLLGSMLSDEINKSVQEKQEATAMDYTVYKVYHDPETCYVGVDYRAKTDCILFIGFYNDEGTELITSVTKDLNASDKGYAEIYALDALPDHYLIKCFIVGKEFQNPLSKPCIYNKHTKQMQEILAKNTGDFDENKTINLDSNDNNNFIVTKKDFIPIESSETADTYVGMTEDNYYLFNNIDKIKGLKANNLVTVYTDDEIIFFQIESIKIEGSSAKIIPADLEDEDIFSFIKIDSSEYTGETKAEVNSFNEDIIESVSFDTNEEKSSAVNEDGSLNLPHTDSMFDYEKSVSKSISKSITFSLQSKEFLDKNVSQKINLNGKIQSQITIGVEMDIEIYIDYDLKLGKKDKYFASIDITQTNKISFELHGEISGEFSLGSYTLYSIGILSIKAEPKIFVSFNGDIGYEVAKTTIKHWDSDNGSLETEKPHTTTCPRCSASLEFGITLELKIIAVNEKIFKAGIEPKIGLSLSIENTTNYQPHIRHDCDACVTGSISVFFDLGFTLTILKDPIDLPSYRIGESTPVSCYINSSGFHFGDCPNICHLIKLKAVDSVTKEPVTGAKVFYSTKNSSQLEPVLGDKKVQYATTSLGETDFFVPDTLLKDVSYSITIIADSGDIGIVNIGSKWQFDPEPESAPEYTVYVMNKEKALELYEKEREEQKNNPDWKPSVSGGAMTYACGYEVDDDGKLIEQKNLTPFEDWRPTVFCTVYPEDSSVGYISGSGAIYGCGAIPDTVKKVVVIDPETKLIMNSFRYSNFESIDISVMSIDNIPPYSFADSKNLTELILSPTIKQITEYSFWNSMNLKSIDLPDSLSLICEHAFSECGLTELNCPRDLVTIKENAFEYCRNLKKINFNSNLEHIGNNAFSYTGLQYLNLPPSVKEIGFSAFYDCKDLRTISISSDFKIPRFEEEYFDTQSFSRPGIFEKCTNLKQVIIKEGVTKIYQAQFVADKNLTYISLPSTLKTIGDFAFAETNLKNVIIPDGVTKIGNGAFSTDTLKSITIQNPSCSCAYFRTAVDAMIKPSKDVIVYGHDGSTAEAFAKENNNTFVSLDKKPTTTTTVTTQTTTTTTTTTAATTIVSAKIRRNNECVFIAVEDAETANAEADKLLADENVGYFDQQKSDEEGVVSFFFIPKALTDWTYIFIEQVNHSRIYKTVITPDGKESTTWWYGEDPEVTMFGDSNGDGMVDLADAILIMQALANPNKYDSRFGNSEKKGLDSKGGLNGDVYDPGSGITGDDALAIQEYLIGKIPSLPVYLNK